MGKYYWPSSEPEINIIPRRTIYGRRLFKSIWGGGSITTLSGAASMLAAEAQGMALDGYDLSAMIKDTTTPANNFDGNVNSKFSYLAPSTKYVLGSDGKFSAGTLLRTSYDAAGFPLGLLIEPAASNLLPYGNAFGNVWWSKDNSAVSTPSVTSIDGSATTQLLTPSANTGQHRLIATPIATTGSQAMSYFVRPNGYTKVAIREGATTGAYAAFNLTGNGAVLDSSAGTASIIALPSGWYRIALVATVTGNASPDIWVLDPTYTAGSIVGNWTANGTSGVFLWCGHLEPGTFPTSPIVTDADSAATRAVDIVRLASGLFPAPGSGYSVYVRAMFPNGAGANYPKPFTLINNAGTERAELFVNPAGVIKLLAIDGGAIQADQPSGASITTGSFFKAAGSWAANDFRISANGTAATTDPAGTVPGPFDFLGIGGTGGGPFYLSQLSVVPRIRTSPELVSIST